MEPGGLEMSGEEGYPWKKWCIGLDYIRITHLMLCTVDQVQIEHSTSLSAVLSEDLHV